MLKYNKQNFVALYRKWYIISSKDKLAYYDSEQVSDLSQLIISELSEILLFYTNQKALAFRGELPIIYITNKGFYKFNSKFMFVDNTIVSLNTSGCIAFAESKIEALKKYIITLIECIDYRFRNNLKNNDSCHYLHIYNYDDNKDRPVSDVVNMLKSLGWKLGHKYTNNSIFIKENYLATISIPINGIITQSLSTWVEKMNYPMSSKDYFLTYGATSGNNTDYGRDTWDAMTDGMYGDYPGGDVNYDVL